jgi:hypothetical protein
MVSPGRVWSVKLSTATTLRERLNISRLALAHPRATIAVWALVAIAGLWAYPHLRLALFPDVTFPLVVVTAAAPGLSPQEAEADLTLPIEQRMHGLRDLKRLESTSSPGKALVAVEFEVGVSLREARHRVDSALAGIQLAGGVVPGTRPIDINESPVITYVLVGEYRTPRNSWARRSAPSCRRSRRCRACCTSCPSGSTPTRWRSWVTPPWIPHCHTQWRGSMGSRAWRSRL